MVSVFLSTIAAILNATMVGIILVILILWGRYSAAWASIGVIIGMVNLAFALTNTTVYSPFATVAGGFALILFLTILLVFGRED